MLNETDSFPASLRGQRRSQALREKYQDAKKGNRPNGRVWWARSKTAGTSRRVNAKMQKK